MIALVIGGIGGDGEREIGIAIVVLFVDGVTGFWFGGYTASDVVDIVFALIGEVKGILDFFIDIVVDGHVAGEGDVVIRAMDIKVIVLLGRIGRTCHGYRRASGDQETSDVTNGGGAHDGWSYEVKGMLDICACCIKCLGAEHR